MAAFLIRTQRGFAVSNMLANLEMWGFSCLPGFDSFSET